MSELGNEACSSVRATSYQNHKSREEYVVLTNLDVRYSGMCDIKSVIY